MGDGRYIDIELRGRQVAASWTRAGRWRTGWERLVWATPLACVVSAALLLPDYACRYRESEPVPGLYLGIILGLGLVMGVVVAVVRGLRQESWILDSKEGVLVYVRTTAWGRTREEHIELEHVKRLLFERKAQGGRVVAIVGDEGFVVELFGARVGGAELEAVYEAMAELIRKAGVAIALGA